MSTGLIRGIQIQDGDILQSTPHGANYTLGIKSDNTLVSYAPNVSAQTILSEGCLNAITAFFPMIVDGTPVNPSVYNGTNQPMEHHPRQVIAQLPNKDILFLTCGGRKKTDLGMTYADVIRILLNRGVSFAYCLDGGGSTSTVIRGIMINDPIDGGGKIERPVVDYLYMKKPVSNSDKLRTVSIDIGNVNKSVSDLKADFNLLGEFTDNVKVIENLNEINESGFYWALSNGTGIPQTGTSWGIIHFQHSPNNAMQLAIPFANSQTYGGLRLRRTNSNGSGSGSYFNWRSL